MIAFLTCEDPEGQDEASLRVVLQVLRRSVGIVVAWGVLIAVLGYLGLRETITGVFVYSIAFVMLWLGLPPRPRGQRIVLLYSERAETLFFLLFLVTLYSRDAPLHRTLLCWLFSPLLLLPVGEWLRQSVRTRVRTARAELACYLVLGAVVGTGLAGLLDAHTWLADVAQARPVGVLVLALLTLIGAPCLWAWWQLATETVEEARERHLSELAEPTDPLITCETDRPLQRSQHWIPQLARGRSSRLKAAIWIWTACALGAYALT